MAKDLREKKPQTIALRNEKSLLSSSWISNPYVKAATSPNTRKAYRSDIRHFEAWGGQLPASAEAIIRYLQTYAAQLNPRTLQRRLVALKQWHLYQALPDPTNHPAIRKTLTGILRVHGKPKQKAHPLTLEELLTLVKYLSQINSFSAIRDKALLLTGFFGAFRRSELVQIEVEHLNWKPQGLDIFIPHSKTDQSNQGQYCALPYSKNFLCPVTAIQEWLELSKIQSGPLFREIKKGEKLQLKALTPLAVNLILKKYAAYCNFTQLKYLSSHSLRRGLASKASQAGVNIAAIMRQGRWKQVNTVMEYIEASERFSDNPALKILQINEETR